MSRNGANGNGKNPIKKPKVGVGRNPTLTPGNPGNSGGKKGRSGRKPSVFVDECSRLTDELVLPKVQEYLAKHKPSGLDPTWRWCADYVTGYGKGKPTQPVAGNNDGDPVEVRVTYEDLIPADDGD